MKSSEYLTRKQVFVPGLGEVIVRIYEGKKQAIMKDSSFLISACGENNKEALELLKQRYQKLTNLMEATD